MATNSEGKGTADAYVDRLGDRLESQDATASQPTPQVGELSRTKTAPPIPLPPPRPARPVPRRVSGAPGENTVPLPPVAPDDSLPPKSAPVGHTASTSGPVVPAVPPKSDPPPVSSPPPDPFAEFEELPSEATQIDQNLAVAEQTTHIIDGAPEPPMLHVTSGKDLGKDFVLGPGETSVGRSIDNDVILTDIAVSRKHIRILRSQDKLHLYDLGSGNGTKLNGEKVRDAPLADGDRIEIGETAFVVKIPASLGENAARTNPPRNVPSQVAGGGASDGHPQMFSGATPLPPSASAMTPTSVDGRAPVEAHVAITPTAVAVPKGLLVALMVVGALLLALLGAAIALLLVKDGHEASATASRALRRGDEAYEAGRYGEALAAYELALGERPGDASATYKVALARAAQHDEAALSAARAALGAGQSARALEALRGVAADGPFAAEAVALRARAVTVAVAAPQGPMDLVAGPAPSPQPPTKIVASPAGGPAPATSPAVAPSGPPALPVGSPQSAPSPVASHAAPPTPSPQGRGSSSVPSPRPSMAAASPTPPVRPVPRASSVTPPSPRPSTSPQVRVAVNPSPTSSPSPSASPRVAPSTRPTATAARTERSEDRVLALYRAGDFTQAAALARAPTEQLSGADRTRLRMLADRIDRFVASRTRAERSGTAGADVLTDLETAYRLDAQIVTGGVYGRQLKPRLIDAYVTSALSSWPRGQFVPACQYVQRALDLDSSNARARGLLTGSCERKAAEWVAEAGRLEVTDAARARQLYLDVQRLVPASSASFQSASQRLRTLAPSGSRPPRRTVDEDEGG